MSVEEQPSMPSGFDCEPARPFRFSLRGLLLFVTCFAIALGGLRWFLVLVGNSKAASREIQCEINLKQLGLAFIFYSRQHGRTSPTFAADPRGKPLYSWRVLILPFLGSKVVPVPAPDKPWNHPLNASLAQLRCVVYHCPDDESSPQTTSYVAVTGPHTAWPGGKGLKLDDIKNPSKTILLVELHDSKINWAEPQDLDIRELARVKAHCHGGGFHACFADGHVELLPADIDLKQLAAMCDPDGG